MQHGLSSRRHLAIALLLAFVAGVRAGAAETLSLEWDPNPEPEVVGYRVFVGTEPGVYTTYIDVGNVTSYSYAAPSPGMRYCFAVAAYFDGPTMGSRSTEVCTDENRPPTLTSPGNQSSALGTALTLTLVGADPEGLPVTYSATGLPAGLTLNRSTGFISGTPTTASAYAVTVTVSDGVMSTSQSFTWTITAAAPTVATLLRPGGTLTTQTPTFEWESVSAATAYRLWVDDSSNTDPRIQLDLTAADAGCATAGAVCRVSPGVLLQPGRGSWSIRASNATGPGPWSGAMDFTVPDTKAPTVVIATPTSAATYTTTATSIAMSGTATDDAGISSVTWTNNLGGSGTATGTSTWSIAAVPIKAGTNIITVTVRDVGGNIGTKVLTVTRSDSSSPTLSIASPAAVSSTASPTVAVNGTASDDGTVTQVTWVNDRGGSGTAAGTTAWSIPAVALKPGANAITVTAQDGAGNRTSKGVTVSLIDGELPTVVITAPVSASTFATTASTIALGGTASDNTGVAQVAWSNNKGGNGVATGTTAWTASVALQPGDNVITVVAKDAAGNSATDVLTVSVTDAAAPQISITVPTSGDAFTTTASSVTVSGTASDASGIKDVRWANDRGGAGVASGTRQWIASAVPLQSGVNVITVAATDLAGNIARDRVTITVDGRAPTISITAPAAGTLTKAETVNLAGSASDDRGVTDVAWSNNRGGSGRATGTTAWSVANAPLQPGVNVFTVVATDDVGNRSAATVSVTRDSLAPAVTIVVPTSAATFTTSKATLALSGKATDDGGTTLVTWNNSRGGSGTTTGTNEWAIPAVALLAGSNVITVTARDATGNVGTATLTVSLDARVPVVSFTTPTSAAGYSTSEAAIGVGGVASDDGAVAEVTWSNSQGGSGVAVGTTSWAVPRVALKLGLNTLTVTARDSSGNVGYATLAVRVADVRAPAVSIVSPSPEPSFSSTVGSINLAGAAADDFGVARVTWVNDRGGSGVATGGASWSIANLVLQSGVNVITVTAWDMSGNASTDVARIAFERGVPRIALTSPTTAASYATSSSNVSLTGVASDEGSIVRVRWSTDKGQSGDALGTTSWSVPALTVPFGTTNVTVTAYDNSGNASSVTLGVVYSDTSKPTVKVYVPTTGGIFQTSSSSVTIGGTAIDNVGVAQVTWTTDRGTSGTAFGTSSWTTPSLPLVAGANVITVTARDGAGNTASTSITIYR